MKRLIYLITLLILVVVSHVALADNAEVNVDQSSTKEQPNENITYLALSADLAAVAQSTKDPVLMLAAARLEAMAATQDGPKDKTTEGEAETAVEKKSENGNLYAMAQEYAGSNEELLALIQDSRGGATSRGLRGGPVPGHRDRVSARTTDIYNLTFEGGEFAEIAVLGDRDTDLDLYVYDENGHEICSDTDLTDQTYCSWRPRWTGRFRIEIRNLGDVYNAYTLLTN